MTDTNPYCPICRSQKTDFAFKTGDFLFSTVTDTFSFYLCTNCGCGFLYPQPNDESLENAYPKTYYWITKNASNLTNRLESFYRKLVITHHVFKTKKLIKSIKPHCRVLDIGCGSGTFPYLLSKNSNICIEGLEPSKEAAESAAGKYGLKIHTAPIEKVKLTDQSFDLITMFHVLEHLRAPQIALRKISKWLTKDGILFLQVPNLESIQFKFFRNRWTGIDVPRHLINFTPKALRILLEENGFKVEKFMFYSLRDSAAAIASSLFPLLDPVVLNVKEKIKFAFLKKIIYFTLMTLLQPFALFESIIGRGGVMFVVARSRHWKEKSYES